MTTPPGDTPDRATTRRVQLVGYYGMGNFGDDLFVDTLKYHAATLWPGSRVATFTPSRSRLYASPRAAGQISRFAAMGAAAVWADAFVFGGGSVLQDVSGIASLRNRIAAKKRREAYGVSIGPFSDAAGERRVAEALARVDRVIVRDASSVEQYRRLLPEKPAPAMGGDLAALSPRLISRARSASVITICPSAAAGVDAERLADQVTLAIQTAQTSRLDVTVQVLALSANPVHGDEELAIELSRRLAVRGIWSSVHFYRQLGLQRTCELLASSTAVWSQRLHGAIVAYLCEVPFLIVGHHAKCHDFAQDIGLVQHCVVAPNTSWALAARYTLSGEPLWRLTAKAYRLRGERTYLA